MYERRTKLLTTGKAAKVGGPLSVSKVCPSMLCAFSRVLVGGWSPIDCECFRTNLNISCPLPTTFVFR